MPLGARISVEDPARSLPLSATTMITFPCRSPDYDECWRQLPRCLWTTWQSVSCRALGQRPGWRAGRLRKRMAWNVRVVLHGETHCQHHNLTPHAYSTLSLLCPASEPGAFLEFKSRRRISVSGKCRQTVCWPTAARYPSQFSGVEEESRCVAPSDHSLSTTRAEGPTALRLWLPWHRELLACGSTMTRSGFGAVIKHVAMRMNHFICQVMPKLSLHHVASIHPRHGQMLWAIVSGNNASAPSFSVTHLTKYARLQYACRTKLWPSNPNAFRSVDQ